MTATTVPGAAPRLRATIAEYVTSTDHKRIGVATVSAALFWFVMGGLLAVLMRTELATAQLDVVSRDTYNQVFTMHGSTMFFLFAAPVAIGIGVYLVPLQIGAAGIVWPRLALAGLWMFMAGGAVMWSGFLTEAGAAKFGWTAFYPLSDSLASPEIGADFWIIGVSLSQVAVVMQAACVIATIVRRRAPGMTFLRLPLFTFSQIPTIFMVITAFPVLVVGFALLYIDRNAGDVFDVPGGTTTYLHLFWFYAHPLVYVVFFPLVGAVGEVIATFSRRRFFGYRIAVLSLLVFAALSTAVWGHHMMTMQTVDNRYFSFTTTAIAIPAGIEYFGFIATMWFGRIALEPPMLFALGFVLLFLIGGLSGIVLGSPPLNYHVHDSHFIVAHFHYTLFGGTVFGLFAAIYFWFPKVTGRVLGERLGRWHFALMFAGALLAFVPLFLLGFDGMPRRVADYLPSRGWETLNVVATLGAYMIAVSVLLFAVNVLRSLRTGPIAGPDPWEGQTLEWVAGSPPSRHNFHRLPPVRSYAPLFDLRAEGKDPHEETTRA